MEEIQARLRRVERRDWWLWGTAILVMLLLALGLLVLSRSTLGKEEHPLFRSHLQQPVLGLLALVLLFSVYVIHQQRLLKRLWAELAEQSVTGSKLQSEVEEFHRLAMRDPLTGLYNRQFLQQHLAGEIARSQRHRYPLNALLIDLDNFRQINERHGQAAGDLVLKELTARLTKSIRSSDLPVRMGSDEFLVLLPDSSLERVPHLLARLTGLEVDFDGEKIAVSFAASWTACAPDEKPHQFLERAEQEVLADKGTGASRQAVERAQAEIRQIQNVEALERLAGKVVHDFNNLLGLVRGYSELALDRLGLSDPLREYIEEIYQANERANSLTRQLLAFTRTRVRPPEMLDLNSLIADMETMLRRMIGHQIALVIKPGEALGRVKGDRGQIEQIVLNLAVNAHDSMPEGGTLTLETANIELDPAYARRHPGARPGSYVMLAAHDTGVGLDAEALSHVFEPFSGTQHKSPGGGLSLAAVYGIVKQNGGYISAEVEFDRGTTFSIYLPCLERTVEAT